MTRWGGQRTSLACHLCVDEHRDVLTQSFSKKIIKGDPLMLAHSVVDVFCMKTEAMRLV